MAAYPEYAALSGRIGKVVASHAEGCRVDSRRGLHRFILCTRRAGGTAHASEFDLPSLTPLSVAGCRRLAATRSYPLGYISSITETI